jgi:hypothetical protein
MLTSIRGHAVAAGFSRPANVRRKADATSEKYAIRFWKTL